ncbi:MAG TPA: NAD(P)H-dependent oxidoreductase [Burkholderiaceae bacterium]|nr:NAD(P)H-dependent oxidoreductase [Burkholderiaceae bacterium]
MNILLVHAHPEAQSLNGTLSRFMRSHLEAAGHALQVSDLHAMRWKATLDADDFPARDRDTPFRPASDSQHAFATGQQTGDVAAEQAKLLWADTVILQFPMWWFSMPAILKGWVDRVYAYGFAYGVGEHSERRWGDRYGEGTLAGKRAMLVVTAGGWASHYGPRGINGPIDDLLFPIQHGILYYPGFSVLPPFVVYRSDRMDAERLAQTQGELAARLDTLATVAPLPFRPQNAGDYDIPAMTLREAFAPGRTGFGIHLATGGA